MSDVTGEIFYSKTGKVTPKDLVISSGGECRTLEPRHSHFILVDATEGDESLHRILQNTALWSELVALETQLRG